MKICISTGHGKSVRGGMGKNIIIYRCTRDDSNGQGTILQYLPSQLVGIYFEEVI